MWFQNKRCKDKKKAIQAEAARMHQQQALQAGAGNVSGLVYAWFLFFCLGDRELKEGGGRGRDGVREGEKEREKGAREREKEWEVGEGGREEEKEKKRENQIEKHS